VASIRILIVDDCAAWRRAVSTMLEEDPKCQIVCEVSDGLEAIQECMDRQPDLVLLDVGLPRLDGLEAARQIRMVAPEAKILFLSAIPWLDVVREALRIGADGYVLKSEAADDLMNAMRAVMEDKQFVSSKLVAE
jgi:DNA-binding NarL/FixJ family response regulator